jgi:hypothetical protein
LTKKGKQEARQVQKRLFGRFLFELASHIEDSVAIGTIHEFVTTLHLRNQLRRKLKLATATGPLTKLGDSKPFSHDL